MATTKTVGIVGAGASGIAACKHVLEAGFRPVVFEAEDAIGGIWAQTLRPTRLLTPKNLYRFTDFPWPPEAEMLPDMSKVVEYLESYARHFDLLRYIQFRSRVVGIEYIGVSEQDMEKWELWGGNGGAFGDGGGRWRVSVKHSDGDKTVSEVHEVDFLIICIGHFSGLPYIPSFPPSRGPEVFKGQVLHSLEYFNMVPNLARKLLEGKRVVVVGLGNSAAEIASDSCDVNGLRYPCTLVHKESRWLVPNDVVARIPLERLYFNRFAEMMLHKPSEGALDGLLATLLSPLRWASSKLVESYVKWKVPMKKYGIMPTHSFLEAMQSTTFSAIPKRFYQGLQEGSILLKKSMEFGFVEDGIITDDGNFVPADVLIFATGFRGDHKIRDIFTSPEMQRVVMGSSAITLPLYRDCIHPRIPQLAVVGHCTSFLHLFTSEMRCIWLAHLLRGGFRLPDIRTMEDDASQWQRYMKEYCQSRSTIGILHNWYNDQLLRDMRCTISKKKGLFDHWFSPYNPEDYGELLPL